VPRLRRSDCAGPGIIRRRAGRGFSYRSPDGRRITDPETLERIRALAVPPAWESVWICPWPHGHIQAVGVDSRGRRQYRYHDQWRVLRDQQKFDHMLLFARDLPGLRRKVARSLKHPIASDSYPGREMVLATAVRLLDLGCFRIGSDAYADENGTYGLASLERRHVHVRGDVITFDFTAKGGQRSVQEVDDREAARIVALLRGRRPASGRLLLDVDSNDINAFIKDQTGGDFTAKQFRTWKATVLAAVSLAGHKKAASATAKKRAVTATMKEVAEYLGDTAAVTRSSYVDPRVVDLYLDGVTLPSELTTKSGAGRAADVVARPKVEAAVLDLLDDEAGAYDRPGARAS
jgi:DNA topoisomerase IB